MKKIIIIFFLTPIVLISQESIKGKIIDENLNPLFNATVHWLNTNIGTTTNENGEFKITTENITNKKLIISFIGYMPDTVIVDENTHSIIKALTTSNNLNTIEIKENLSGSYIDKEQAIKVEVITKKELTKAACCDLAGCFETQSSVAPMTTNVITQTKELRLLGLSGVYNQLLIENIPSLYGLNYTYGISLIPGSLIKQIHISQGLASVLQGHESITGQINVALKEPNEKDNMFINLYMNSFLAKQSYIDYNFKIGKWKSLISISSKFPANKIDENNDTFLDIPIHTEHSVYNKWVYGSIDKLYIVTALRYTNEKIIGGHIDFNEDIDKGSNIRYGQIINFSQPEIYLKMSYRLNPKQTLISQSSCSNHDQRSFFGTTKYLANQTIYYFNFAHVLNWKNHKITSGIQYKAQNLEEEIIFNDNLNRTYNGIPKNEQIPAIYIENHFKWNNENISFITGLRLDNHNQHGLFLTPRSLLKYNISENTIARMSIGSGWRTINLFSENINLLACNKEITIADNLKPEQALNYGFNILHTIYRESSEYQITIDFYKTLFSNQIYPDYFRESSIIYVENFEEKSVSNSFQMEFAAEIGQSIGIKIGYNYLDIFKIEDGNKIQLPFNSKHHILNTVSYQPIRKNWKIDFNLHWNGEKKLIDQNETHDLMSDPYMIQNIQFTQKINNFELYIGCENISNFTQKNPIIGWENPFGENFDISNIWGPTKGREFYLGLRLTL